METKICIKCEKEKEISEFASKHIGKYTKKCKECRAKSKEYEERNKERISARRKKKYYERNKEEIEERNRTKMEKEKIGEKELRRRYCEENREKINEYKRRYNNKNKDKSKKYRENNKERIKANKKLYYENNKDKIREKANIRIKQRILKDVCFRLRRIVSNSIYSCLRRSKTSKKSSILKYLPYTIEYLKKHIESQFESWMNWENYGMITDKERRWQIDHIIPQSLLLYDSMEHPNFLKCWALENLRPLEAMENVRKSNKIL
jgi:hypothetical protein